MSSKAIIIFPYQGYDHMAGVSVTIIPIILVYLVMQKYIISGITAGALKG